MFFEENNILSSYYFGTRVIYTEKEKANNVDMKNNSNFLKNQNFDMGKISIWWKMTKKTIYF